MGFGSRLVGGEIVGPCRPQNHQFRRGLAARGDRRHGLAQVRRPHVGLSDLFPNRRVRQDLYTLQTPRHKVRKAVDCDY